MDDLWPNLEIPRSVEVLQWVEKRHDNDMADKIEKAERVVQQDILEGIFVDIIMSQDIHLGLSVRKKRDSPRGPHWKGKKRGGVGENARKKGHHIMHVQDCHVSCSEIYRRPRCGSLSRVG